MKEASVPRWLSLWARRVNVGVIGCLMFDGVAGSVGESGAKKLWSLALPFSFSFDWSHLALDTEA